LGVKNKKTKAKSQGGRRDGHGRTWGGRKKRTCFCKMARRTSKGKLSPTNLRIPSGKLDGVVLRLVGSRGAWKVLRSAVRRGTSGERDQSPLSKRGSRGPRGEGKEKGTSRYIKTVQGGGRRWGMSGGGRIRKRKKGSNNLLGATKSGQKNDNRRAGV